MKGIVLTIAALATGATLFTAAPASAQTVGVVIREPGVSVRFGEQPRRHWNRGHHRGWYRAQASCKQTTVRTVRPNGTVVITKRSSC